MQIIKKTFLLKIIKLLYNITKIPIDILSGIKINFWNTPLTSFLLFFILGIDLIIRGIMAWLVEKYDMASINIYKGLIQIILFILSINSKLIYIKIFCFLFFLERICYCIYFYHNQSEFVKYYIITSAFYLHTFLTLDPKLIIKDLF